MLTTPIVHRYSSVMWYRSVLFNIFTQVDINPDTSLRTSPYFVVSEMFTQLNIWTLRNSVGQVYGGRDGYYPVTFGRRCVTQEFEKGCIRATFLACAEYENLFSSNNRDSTRIKT